MENTKKTMTIDENGKTANAPVKKCTRKPRNDVTDGDQIRFNITDSRKMYDPPIYKGMTVLFYDERAEGYTKGKISYINKKRGWFLVENEAYDCATGSPVALKTGFLFSDLYLTSYSGQKSVLWTEYDFRWYEEYKKRSLEKKRRTDMFGRVTKNADEEEADSDASDDALRFLCA